MDRVGDGPLSDGPTKQGRALRRPFSRAGVGYGAVGAGVLPGGGMDTVRRLMWFVVGVLLSAVCTLVAAETESIPATSTPGGWKTSGIDYPSSICRADKASVCAAVTWQGGGFSLKADGQCWKGSQYVINPVACSYYSCPAGQGWSVSGSLCVREACKAGETRNAQGFCEAPCQPAGLGEDVGACGCAQGLQLVGGKCEKDCTDMSGRVAGSSSNYANLRVDDPRNYNGNTAFCVEGCAAVAQGGVQCYWSNSTGVTGDRVAIGGHCQGKGPFQFNGRNCSSYGAGISEVENYESDPEKPWYDTGKDPNDCAKSGGTWGEVNGSSVCVRAGTGGGGEGTEQGGSTTGGETKTTTGDGAGGTTTTSETSTTKCENGNCTTTTTKTTSGTNSDGTPKPETTETTRTEQPQTDFCKANPAAPGCQGTEADTSSWGGSCADGFQCSGDAVQCATARAAWSEECRWRNTDGTTLADAMAAGNDPAFAGAGGNPLVPVDYDVGSITYTSQAQTCPPDFSVSVMGKTMVMPLAQACDVFKLMGQILVGLAWLAAFYIVSRSVR